MRNYSTGVKNQSSGYRYISCPIDREVVWYNGPYQTSIQVKIYNYGGTFSCTGYNTDQSTGSITEDTVSAVVTTSDSALTR